MREISAWYKRSNVHKDFVSLLSSLFQILFQSSIFLPPLFLVFMADLEQSSPESLGNTDAPNEQADGTNDNSWLAGFLDIITAPEELATRYVRSPGRVIAFASLLLTFVSVGATYLYSLNDGISSQMYSMQAQTVEKIMRKQGVAEGQIEQELEKVRERLEFSLVRTLGVSIIFVMISMFLYGFLFWILQRLFNSEPPPALAIIGLVNYGASIAALGILVNCLIQFATNSMFISLSPTAFIDLSDNPAMVQFYGRINPFTFWEYIVAGIVTARHVGMSRKQGIGIGVTALVIVLMFTGAFAWASSRLFS